MHYIALAKELRELRNEAWSESDAGLIGDKIDDLLKKLYDAEIKRIENLTK